MNVRFISKWFSEKVVQMLELVPVVRLTPREQELVSALGDGIIHSIPELYAEMDSVGNPAEAVRAYVWRVRQKLGRDAILSWPGRGYSLNRDTVCPTCHKPF